MVRILCFLCSFAFLLAAARAEPEAPACSGNPPFAGWYAVYHRRPLGETDGNHRITCIDLMEFDERGFIKPIRITREGVPGRLLKDGLKD